jgi:thiol-disulfide isomerase/thioredoxin
MLVVGVLTGRLAFVWEWKASYVADPLTILDIRDGGWNAAAGVAAACLYGLYTVRRRGQPRRPVVGAVLSTGLLWIAGTTALILWPRDSMPLPPLSLLSTDGAPVALSSFTGKPTVINLWATWCPPCRREMPVLQQAQAANADINFVFVNQGETPESVSRYLREQELPLHNVLIDAHLEVGKSLGQRALPTTLFFDARGQLMSSRIGELSHATLTQRLADLRSASDRR